VLSRSKLGPHDLAPNAASLKLVQAGCRVAKLVSGNLGASWDYLAANPNLLVVGRHYTSHTAREDWVSGKSPEVSAWQFIGNQKSTYDANPLIKYWEGHNEVSFGDIRNPAEAAQVLNGLNWYARHEVERLKLLNDIGLRGVVGNFSTGYPEIVNPDGTPDLRSWNAFLPALQAANDYQGILGLHEYGSPYLRHWTFNHPTFGLMGWLILRYRQVYNFVIRPNRLNVPIFIGECGHDAAGGGDGLPTGNWRDLIPYWRSQGILNPENFYAEEFISLDTEWQKDDYLLGVTPFTFGTDNSTWERYRVDNADKFVSQLVNYIRSSVGEPVPLEEPPPMSQFPSGIVKVVHPDGVPVRKTGPTGPKDGHQSLGARGRVIGNPYTISKEPRYQIDYDSGDDGWTGVSGLMDSARLQYPAEWGVTGHFNVPPHRTQHAYRTLEPLDLGEPPDPHWTGVQDSWGSFDFDGLRWVNGTWYLCVTDGKSFWGGTLYVPWEETRDGEQQVLNVGLNGPGPDWMDYPLLGVVEPPPPPPDEPPPPPPVDTENLLVNGSFEIVPSERWPAETHMSGLQIPGWELEKFSRATDARLLKQDQPSGIPEILPIRYLVQFPEPHLVYDKAGVWILKIFLDSQPGGAQFGQTVTQPAGKYELRVPFFPDQWTWDRRRPNTSADWHLGTEVAAWVGELPADHIPWLNGLQAPMGEYTVVRHRFVHAGGSVRVHFAVRGRWGFKNNGWFVDGVKLVSVGDVEPPPPPVEIDITAQTVNITLALIGIRLYLDSIDADLAMITRKVAGD